ncbi:MAG: hypothetical protein LBD77_03385 [Bifidobacteriaceae bacterium]|nr:hypothetical protein [Bifidobacteriaceae bacterium]
MDKAKRPRRATAPPATIISSAELTSAGPAAGGRPPPVGPAAPPAARAAGPLPTVSESDSPAAWGDAEQTPDSDFLEAVPPHW